MPGLPANRSRRVDRAVGRHRDHRDVAGDRACGFEQRETVQLRHSQIGDEQVDLAVPDRSKRSATRAERACCIAAIG
jgi:hypothetical protein